MQFLPIAHILSTLVLGAILGFLGGLFGIGGGVIAIPFLVLVFGMEQALAQGTSLAMMVPILLVGWWRYSHRHPIPWPMATKIGLLASVTTWLVAKTATSLNPLTLRTAFALFLFLLAVRMLAKKQDPSADQPTPRINLGLMPLVGLIGGACMGLLGVGGGLLATPMFKSLFAQRQTVAQSLSLALVTPCSIIALMTYGGAELVDWSIGLSMAIGGLTTVSHGVTLAHRLPEQTMRRAFAWMILGTAAWLLFKSIYFR